MISFLDPRIWLAFLLTVLLSAGAGYIKGEKDEHKAAVARELAITSAAKDEKIAADADHRAKEQALAESFDRRIAAQHQEQADEKATADRLIADLRAHNKRMSIPVVGPVCPGGADPGASVATGTSGEGRAELTPDAAEFLVRLAERGDAAIRKHAAVVDLYNDLRQACMHE